MLAVVANKSFLIKTSYVKVGSGVRPRQGALAYPEQGTGNLFATANAPNSFVSNAIF